MIGNPTIAEPANELHNAFRLKGKLDRRLFELLVTMVAHQWAAPYAWSVHEKLAIKAGVSPSTLEAIREDREPECLPADERMVYDAVREILDHKALSPPTFHLLLGTLGLEQLIELVTAVGFYGMLCGVLNVFQIPAHEQ